MKDTINLRHSADFETYLSPDVLWIPVNYLGGSRYTATEIMAMVAKSPEEKRKMIATLYEACQLFQASHFVESDDIMRVKKNGVVWQYHKSGYRAVLENCGCCAANASWLAYILEGKYDELGYLLYYRHTGSGHIVNYILHKGMYFIIDLLPMEDQYIKDICAETGAKQDLRKSKYISCILTKSFSLESYARFFSRYLCRNNRSHLFFQIKGIDVPPSATIIENNRATICLPKTSRIVSLQHNQRVLGIGYREIASF